MLVCSYFYNSDSSGSVQSWASSLSADSQSEEAAADFMKSFVPLLFDAPNTIDQEQKANFGQMVLVCVLKSVVTFFEWLI